MNNEQRKDGRTDEYFRMKLPKRTWKRVKGKLMDDATCPHLFILRRDRVKTPESLSHTLMRNLSSVPEEIFGHNRSESYSYQPSQLHVK
jgi:hypothetical protein